MMDRYRVSSSSPDSVEGVDVASIGGAVVGSLVGAATGVSAATEPAVGEGGGGLPAVRAQAIVPVQSLFCRLCGIDFGPFRVRAKTTAVYDCATGRSRLIRVDRFICPGPDP